ncbi:DUF3307 domain-containing protein [Grimontia sp. NTOU-MAR1]|uniref:DUF3307 domain-containing protein n=1 Tax=Grimontia sp. NTOU-MAR1 TaxID=3111011 RepID=UPI002DBD9B3A|nr:DUF3307 domain-containing protein [Grimontia sp. NTOU-MAR1]WRV98139.1 DUF3307 domain-containing protein [Grimontia sp. NTOU-MAR1]
MLTLILVLVVIHIFSEFYLFPIMESKRKGLFLVTVLQAGLAFVAFTAVVASILTVFIATFALAVQYLVLSYCMIMPAERLRGMLLKFTLHIVLISLITAFAVNPDQRHIAWEAMVSVKWQTLICWTLAYLLALKPSSSAIALILQNWAQELTATEDAASNRPLKEAGTFIGYFERTLIVTFVLWGQLPGVALVLAAKSVFRFGDLKDHGSRMFTEYVMLGTFASAMFGIGCGLLGDYLGKL